MPASGATKPTQDTQQGGLQVEASQIVSNTEGEEGEGLAL